ncbi:MAG: putative selenium-dependent hydroxylase accessory protein YqeC [Candidatus Atribacteria bacterium]
MLISEAVGLKERAFISLVGAGGKSTLFRRLAEELSRQKKRIILTTTTKMFAWQLSPFIKEDNLFEGKEEDIIQRKVEKYFFTAGQRGEAVIVRDRKEGERGTKFCGPSSEGLDKWWHLGLADFFLVEADGAQEKPLKAPAFHEPVIPSSTTDVIGVIGIEAVNLPLKEENVFRAQIFAKITGIKLGDKIGIEALTALVCHPQGLFKGASRNCKCHLFINKVDDEERHILANKLAYQVLQSCPERVQDIIIGVAIQDKDKVVIDLIKGRR